MLLLVPKPPTPPPSPLHPPTAASVGDWNERYIRTLPPEALKNQDLASFTLHQELQGLRSSCFASLTNLSAHFNFNYFVSMQLLSSLVSLLLVLYSVRAAAVLPVEERNPAQSRELSKEHKELILKLISGLLDGADNSVLAGEIAPVPLDVEEPLESRLEERAVYNRLSQLPQRDRKAPCKNFFWKTFTSC
ncbi:somatostatin-1B-like [Sinocyclocheilus anshuiensis]|nr:PREDICTED: somatostatin-1B-like [Sinocyclocheilus anshuiensis]